MRCNDCGKTDYPPSASTRSDVCPDCWELRGQFVAKISTIPLPQLLACQRKIANSHGSGRGARAMREVLGLDQPQI
jgi:hypothetical protein